MGEAFPGDGREVTDLTIDDILPDNTDDVLSLAETVPPSQLLDMMSTARNSLIESKAKLAEAEADVTSKMEHLAKLTRAYQLSQDANPGV